MRWLGNYILEWLKGPWPEIYFIRHSHGFHQLKNEIKDKSKKNGISTICADIPNHEIPLDPLGRWQAEETRKYLDIKPDVVYTSYMLRAQETAQIIFPDIPIRIDPRLNEKALGPGHMLDDEEMYKLFPSYIEHYELVGKYWASKIPDGENYLDLYLRNHDILGTFRNDWAGKKIAVVSHAAEILSMVQLFDHCTPETLMERAEHELKIPNCGILHYSWPKDTLKGWKNGKFRLELEKLPYKLWELSPEQEEIFLNEAIAEAKELIKRRRGY